MEKITFVNGQEPALNGTNLNQLQTNVEDAINTLQANVEDEITEATNTLQTNINNIKHEDITTNGEPVKCGYKIDGKDVYTKRVSGTFDGSSSTQVITNLSSLNYTPIDFNVNLDTGLSFFKGFTPRAAGKEVVDTQLTAYWEYTSDRVTVISNGFDRTGSTVLIDLYFTYK